MPLVINPAATPAQYLLSNGTRVVSEVAVNYYTPQEILKIEIAGGILVIAVLVLTFTAYQWWNIRYKYWLRQKELEEKIEAGFEVDPTEPVELPPSINKVALYIVGGLIMLSGIVMYFMP